MPNQFPSKFGALPQISARDSPEVNGHNQLVPLHRIDGLEAEEKIRQLETRINVTEKSNRALLEEVVRLQSELKGNVRRGDEMLREERNSRSQLENALRANNDIIQQLTNRLTRAEEKSQEERNAISSLVNHTKSVEQAVLGSQQELLSRRDVQNQKMSDLKRELDEVARAKEALERLSYQLVDEVRQTKNKVETQQVDFHQSAQEFKNKSKKLEEENRQMKLDNLRKQNESSNHTEQNSSQLKQQVETRLGELRDILVELRNKQDTETQERRLLEQQLQMKVNDIHNGLAEQTRKREEAMHALDVVQREREHAAENERIRLQSKIAEIAEEVSKKILHKEIKLREEATDKFSKIEKFVTEEHDARMTYESNVRDDVEERWQELQKGQQESLRNVKDMQKMDRQKYAETIQKLDEALNILEEQVDQQRKQNDKLMAAEIKSRKQHEAFTLEKVEDLQEKLSLGITTLQQAIGGVTTQFEKEIKQLKRLVGTGGSVGPAGSTTGLSIGEIEDKIEEIVGTAVKNLRNAVDKKLEETATLKRDAISSGQTGAGNSERIDELAEDQARRMLKVKKELEATMNTHDEKLQALIAWQTSLKKTLKDISKIKDLPDDMYSLDKKTTEKLGDFKSKLAAELEGRNKDVENLRKDIARISQQPRGGGGAAAGPIQLGPSREDVEACQSSVRTLAESVQTVKTVLGLKIQSEQKLRAKDIEVLNKEIEDVRRQLEPLLRTKPVPRLFIKAKPNMDRDEAEKGQPVINKWSVYTAYRWLKFKEKLMNIRSDGTTSPTETATETEATTEVSSRHPRGSSPTETEATTEVPTKTNDRTSASSSSRPKQKRTDDTTTSATSKSSRTSRTSKGRTSAGSRTSKSSATTAQHKAKKDDTDDDDDDTTTEATTAVPEKKKPSAKKKSDDTTTEATTSKDDDDDDDDDDTTTATSTKKKTDDTSEDDTETETETGTETDDDDDDDTASEATRAKKGGKK